MIVVLKVPLSRAKFPSLRFNIAFRVINVLIKAHAFSQFIWNPGGLNFC